MMTNLMLRLTLADAFISEHTHYIAVPIFVGTSIISEIGTFSFFMVFDLSRLAGFSNIISCTFPPVAKIGRAERAQNTSN